MDQVETVGHRAQDHARARSEHPAGDSLADSIEAGMVGINTFAITLPETPFGGVKESGYGMEGGVEGLESYLNTKFVSQGPSTPSRRP